MNEVLEILRSALDLENPDDVKGAVADAIVVAENAMNDPRPATTDTTIIEKILLQHGEALHDIANFLQGMAIAKPSPARTRKPAPKPAAKKGAARGRRSGR